MERNDDLEKARLLKEALEIVDELANMIIDEDQDEIDKLIDKSKFLKKNRLWRL